MSAVALCCLNSCTGKTPPIYTHFVNIDPDGWHSGEYCVYDMADADSLTLADTKRNYDILLTVRHTTDYPYNDLWLEIERPTKADSISSHKIEIELSDPNGSWKGKGMQGIYEFSDTLVKGVKLSPEDVLTLKHDMPVASLPGILDLGLIIIESQPHQK